MQPTEPIETHVYGQTYQPQKPMYQQQPQIKYYTPAPESKNQYARHPDNRTSSRKVWDFTKWFIPYFLLLTGLVLVVAGMSDVGIVPASPTCNDWRQANHEYNYIRQASTANLPDLSLQRFSNACGLWKTWFATAILSLIFYFAILAWPMGYTIGKRGAMIAMEVTAGFAVLFSLLAFIFVIVFFGVGGAWKYDWKCQTGNPPSCAWYSGGMPYPQVPPPEQLPLVNSSEALRTVLVDPKFFARYGLDRYGTADTTMTCIGAFLGSLGCVLLTLVERSRYKTYLKSPSSTIGGTPMATSPMERAAAEAPAVSQSPMIGIPPGNIHQEQVTPSGYPGQLTGQSMTRRGLTEPIQLTQNQPQDQSTIIYRPVAQASATVL